MADIDATDYALLVCLAEAAEPIWKKRVHERLQSPELSLPGNTELSLQTIGRRINELHEQGLVETEITHPEDASQNLIIGYTLTDTGIHALNEKRGDIIGSYAIQQNTDLTSKDRETLLQLLRDELELTEEEYKTLHDHSIEELRVFTLAYYAHSLVASTLDEQTAETFFDIIARRERGHFWKGPQTYSDCYG